MNRVAVSGMGCICAAGKSVDETWQSILQSSTNCHPVPPWLFKTKLDYPVFAAPEISLTPSVAELLSSINLNSIEESASRTILLALSAAAEALSQAGLSLTQLQGKKLGIALGTTVGCTFHNEEYYCAWRDGKKPDLRPIHYFLNGNIAAALHRILGTSGPSAVVTNACASGTDAIGLAKDWVANGLCDYALAGGADELSRVAYNGFVSLMLSDKHICRPFDQDRKGLNLGEGAGVLLLEPFSQATERKQPIHGIVKGYGAASDAWHPTAPHPQGRGLKKALEIAIQEAEMTPNKITLVNAHGTGTKANDIAETSALAEFFSGDQTYIMSTKGATGHTLGAAGGLEAIFTLKALGHGVTCGTVGCGCPDDTFPIRPLCQGEIRKLHSRYGISQSLAFGGGNAALVLETLP